MEKREEYSFVRNQKEIHSYFCFGQKTTTDTIVNNKLIL